MEAMVVVSYRFTDPRAVAPVYCTEGAAGADITTIEEAWLQPGKWQAFRTGLELAIPAGYEAQLRPRSGLALKYCIFIPNSPATIDSDFRGELRVILANGGDVEVHIKEGDRIAQMIVAPVVRATFLKVDKLKETDRGQGGFGHTGR